MPIARGKSQKVLPSLVVGLIRWVVGKGVTREKAIPTERNFNS